MPIRARKRLSSTEALSPTAERVKEANEFLSNYPLPRILNRKKWTKRDWKRHEDAWADLDRARRQRQRASGVVERKMHLRVKRIRHHKVLRELRRSERQERLDQREGKKIGKNIIQREHSEQVLTALRNGATTVGQVRKRTGLETRATRRCLRKLVQSGEVEKPSSRRYYLTEPKQHKRRRHLTKESKAR